MKETSSKIGKKILSDLDRLDWDFNSARPGNGTSIHWYPSRFVPDIPSLLIGKLCRPDALVLDPFVGCGTTIVEAVRLGRRGFGIDLNPVGLLAAKARLVRLSKNTRNSLKDIFLSGFRVTSKRELGAIKSEIKNIKEIEDWYESRTLQELLTIYGMIDSFRGQSAYLILKASFSAVLNSVCSRREHFGWICDNVKPKKSLYLNAIKAFNSKLDSYLDANYEFFHFMDLRDGDHVNISDKFTFKQGDAVEVLKALETNSVDLVVTSPPYFGVTDYIKAFRLFSLWFPEELDLALKQNEIGARYKRNRRTAKMEYLDALLEVFDAVYLKLKPGRPMVLVLGESNRRPKYIRELDERLCKSGLKLIHSLDRSISLRRVLKPSILKEQIRFYVKVKK